MSNQEMVELFMGGLSNEFRQAVSHYLSANRQILDNGKDEEPRERQPEDRYSLGKVCQVAKEISENAQGIFAYQL